MNRFSRAERTRYQLLGVAFLVFAVLFVALTVGIYRKVFTPVVLVTLQADRTGTQLNDGADVKVRGVRVGSVRDVTASAAGASVTLALDPDSVALVPANVTARLLPKTLFGERYVDLQIPAAPAAPIAKGDVIPADRSRSAIEVEQVLDHLMPTLQAVRPAQLATTLGALSQALHGQGGALGHSLVSLDSYLKGFNPAVPDLIASLNRLGPVADTYAEAAPDLFGGLADLTTTSRTFADKRDELHRLFVGVTGASDDLGDFLDHNEDNLVDLASTSRPLVQLLDKYSPEYPCLFHQLVTGIPRAEKVFGKGSDHPEQQRLTIEISANRGKYLPGVDTPRNLDKRGPRCYSQDAVSPQYAPGGPLRDGARKPPAPSDAPDPRLRLLGLSLLGPQTGAGASGAGASGTGSTGTGGGSSPLLPLLGGSGSPDGAAAPPDDAGSAGPLDQVLGGPR